MTTEQITLHLCEVIAEQKKVINTLEGSNDYLRNEINELVQRINSLNAKVTELETQIEVLKTENFDAQTLIGGLELKIAEIEIAYDQLKEGIRNGK